MKSDPTMDETLDRIKRQLGFLPNLFKEMSKAPAVLGVYLKGQEALSQGSLTAREQQVVQLTVAVFNDCQYCKAAHSWLGQKMGLSREEVQEMGSELSQQTDPQVANLVRATKLILENRGWIDPEEIIRFEQQGIDRVKLYEIIAFIGLKTISNYINHIAETPIDEEFNS